MQQKEERRRKGRRTEGAVGEVQLEVRGNHGNKKVIRTKLADISYFGCGVDTASPLEVGAKLGVRGRFLANGSAKWRGAQVVHCRLLDEDVYRVGLAFEEPAQENGGADRTIGVIDGSFVDHYEALQLSPSATLDTIQRVYRLLALRYHPDNPDTGSAQTFRLVLQAYRVLSDPEQRAAYDVKHRATRQAHWKIFDQPEQAQGFEGEARKRWGTLSILYAKRNNQARQPEVTLRELESLLGCPCEHLEFTLWYLKGKSLVAVADGSRYTITPKGVDEVEKHGPECSREHPALLEAASSQARPNGSEKDHGASVNEKQNRRNASSIDKPVIHT